MNDAANAKAISAILRAIGNADEAKERKTDVVFLEAAKLIDAAYGTSPTPPHPAQSSGGAKDAPVAWRLKYNGCDLIEVYISEEEAKRHARNYNAELQPLYLHPSPPEPSDAAWAHEAALKELGPAADGWSITELALVKLAEGRPPSQAAIEAAAHKLFGEDWNNPVNIAIMRNVLLAAYAVDRRAR